MRLFKRQSDQNASPPGQRRREPGRQPLQAYSSLNNRQPAWRPDGQRERNPNRTRNAPAAGQNRTFSYYANRSQAELNTGRESLSDKPLPRRLPGRFHRLRIHAGWVTGGVLLLAVVLYQLQLSSTPKVVSLVPASDAPFLRDGRVYQEAATKLISNTPTNRNKLTINTTAISSQLREQFPELQSVTVGLPLIGDTPTIYLRPADPALVLVTDNETFIVDQQGRALSTMTSEAQLTRLKVPTVTDNSKLNFELGDQALSRSVTTFIQTVARQHRAHKADIRAMILPAGSSELDVYPAGKPYFIKYNVHTATADAEKAATLQAGTYEAVRRHLEAKNQTPDQYVDVRLPGRAYYK